MIVQLRGKFVAGVVVMVAALVLAGCGAGAGENSDSESAYIAECPKVDVADVTAITQERADMLVGFSESGAESCATSLGWAFRVGERDGESFALTADYSLQRVTVSMNNGLVSEVTIG